MSVPKNPKPELGAVGVVPIEGRKVLGRIKSVEGHHLTLDLALEGGEATCTVEEFQELESPRPEPGAEGLVWIDGEAVIGTVLSVDGDCITLAFDAEERTFATKDVARVGNAPGKRF